MKWILKINNFNTEYGIDFESEIILNQESTLKQILTPGIEIKWNREILKASHASMWSELLPAWYLLIENRAVLKNVFGSIFILVIYCIVL